MGLVDCFTALQYMSSFEESAYIFTAKCLFGCLFVYLFVFYLLTQAGFSGSYAADMGLRPTVKTEDDRCND